ncbi:MAG TPA: class I SAM-dependent methyltransferase [Anaerolineae bacterium]|nr:class I SAM-dependent methyltransferase [Anaerolineae bacterium]
MIHRLFFEFRYLLGMAPWDTGISPPELMRFIETHVAGRALDIGCGTGTNALTLAEHGWQVTGIDFSRQAISRARRKARKRELETEFIQGQVTTLEKLTGPYDLCLDIGCYHSLPPTAHERYFQRLAELLRAGGTYLLYTFLVAEGTLSPIWPTENRLRRFASKVFDLRSVEHGSHRHRPSAWFTFQRKPQ